MDTNRERDGDRIGRENIELKRKGVRYNRHEGKSVSIVIDIRRTITI